MHHLEVVLLSGWLLRDFFHLNKKKEKPGLPRCMLLRQVTVVRPRPLLKLAADNFFALTHRSGENPAAVHTAAKGNKVVLLKKKVLFILIEHRFSRLWNVEHLIMKQ